MVDLRRLACIVGLLLCAVVGGGSGKAAELPAPTGPVLLTVTGKIARTTAPGRAEFDRQTLEALGRAELRTSSAFTDGVSVFEGVPLCAVLDAVGAHGGSLLARALNDYSAEIPIDDCRRYPVLLALSRDGVALHRRDKGPLWIIYPRDDHPELRNEQVNSRWVWQLERLEIR